MNNLPHVNLRAVEPEDLDMLYRIENDFELWGVGATNVPYSRFALQEYIASNTSDIYADRQLRTMICNDDAEVVGIIDLMNFNPQHLRAEVGIVIQQQYRGRGYGFVAMKKLVEYTHKVLHLHQLYAIISTDNTNCIKLFERAGFNQGAELKEWLYDGVAYHDAIVMQTFL